MAGPRVPAAVRVARLWGVARSLAIYHGIPGRAARQRRFHAPFVRRGGLCFDVGAHVGNRTRAFRALGARVVAVEPQADCLRVLQRLFGADPDVVLVHAAVGESPGRARLLECATNPTVGTLDADWVRRAAEVSGFAHLRWTAGDEVPVTTLDALIASHGVPDFVKIDVEGHEAAVLRGLSRPLRALSFEVLPALRERAIACVDRLAALGDYAFERTRGERLVLEGGGWCDADAIRAWLAALPDDAPSGDVIACLRAELPAGARGD